MRVVVLLISLVTLSACSPNAGVTEKIFGSSTVMIAPGNLRLIVERSREGHPPVVCTEPSPDYAVAFGTTNSLTLRSTPAGGTANEAVGSHIATENVTQGLGRGAAVLALRDGLYAACQAYANGIIGQDAYSLVLSQYGTLLATIVHEPNDAGRTAYSNDGAAALLTACISAHDPTRNPPSRNALLDLNFCRNMLNRIGRGR